MVSQSPYFATMSPILQKEPIVDLAIATMKEVLPHYIKTKIPQMPTVLLAYMFLSIFSVV